MLYWNCGDIDVDANVNIDLNKYAREYREDIIKLFSDSELKAELLMREKGESQHEKYIRELDIDDNLTVCVDSYDVLSEVDNSDLLSEVAERGLNTIEYIEVSKDELRNFICQTLDINELYTDEEIFELLKEIWKTR